MSSRDQQHGDRQTSSDFDTPSGDPLKSVATWFLVAAVSTAVFLFTMSPLLASVWPYLRAGWPAVRTAWWLRKVDPWPIRGKVGFYFHLAMAGFRAGVAGLLMVLLSGLIADARQGIPDLTQFIIAMCVILTGMSMSFLFGWWGTILAFRHGVRVFVISNLRDICHGDFSQIERLSPRRYHTNPANFVMAVAISGPALALWFAAMLTTIPDPTQPQAPTVSAAILLGALPVLGVGCIALLIFLSTRVIARTPQECWLAVPTSDHEVNWYGESD